MRVRNGCGWKQDFTPAERVQATKVVQYSDGPMQTRGAFVSRRRASVMLCERCYRILTFD